MTNGYVIYDGASLLNGERIIAIALTSKTNNSKTGDMMQTYIITPHDPRDASKHGWDSANCGDCIHRGTPTNDPNRKQAKGRTCYVKLYQGVLQVWRQWKKGAYPMLKGHDALAKLGESKDVRVGTYGDGVLFQVIFGIVYLLKQESIRLIAISLTILILVLMLQDTWYRLILYQLLLSIGS